MLAIAVLVEAAIMAAVTVTLVVDILVSPSASVLSALALTLLAALAAVWLVVLALATLRARPWIRSGVIVWQVVQIAVAIGSLQGPAPRVDIATALLVPSIVGLVLVFTPSVVGATRRV